MWCDGNQNLSDLTFNIILFSFQWVKITFSIIVNIRNKKNSKRRLECNTFCCILVNNRLFTLDLLDSLVLDNVSFVDNSCTWFPGECNNWDPSLSGHNGCGGRFSVWNNHDFCLPNPDWRELPFADSGVCWSVSSCSVIRPSEFVSSECLWSDFNSCEFCSYGTDSCTFCLSDLALFRRCDHFFKMLTSSCLAFVLSGRGLWKRETQVEKLKH